MLSLSPLNKFKNLKNKAFFASLPLKANVKLFRIVLNERKILATVFPEHKIMRTQMVLLAKSSTEHFISYLKRTLV